MELSDFDKCEIPLLTMNALKGALPGLQRVTNYLSLAAVNQRTHKLYQLQSRCFSSLYKGLTQNTDALQLSSTAVLVSSTNSILCQHVRTYKSRRVLQLRCEGCYYEKRFGRLYVECSLERRHKQMKVVYKRYLYKDDYSEGDIKNAAHFNYRTDRFYRNGNNKFARYNWLEGRLGTEI